ncbi:hypothetical protein AS189_00550 [Arthrobacter alpinus]|uniref:Pentapeptide repeat-containing protein n=2 Tax=Arthrobacter alpinus TaxID=656366 RepID=A0A0S2LV47_9MICC|nr:hypothetical protein AS189_00550 [Arthrobacter alpinus]
MPRRRAWQSLAWSVAAVVFIVAAAAAIRWIPEFLVGWALQSNPNPVAGLSLTVAEYVTAVTNARQGVLFAVGGIIAVFTLLITLAKHNLDREKQILDQDANWTNRYTEAIKQLGDDSTSVRLGGIYALERIAQDSLRDRQTILDVLCANLLDISPVVESSGPETVSVDTTAVAAVVGRITKLSPPRQTVVLRGTNLTRVPLDSADLAHADLAYANLTRAYLTYANLNGASLNGTDLTGAYLAKALLNGSKFNDANLTGALLNGANLTRANLTRANLTGTNLTGTNLTDAYLTHANVTGANLTDADLTRADLTGANLTGTNLTGADLTGANLTGADLTGANLTGTYLTGADLTGANLTGAIMWGQTNSGKNYEVKITREYLKYRHAKGIDKIKGLPVEGNTALT